MRKYSSLSSVLFVSIVISISLPSPAHSYPQENADHNSKQCQYCYLLGKQYKTVSSSTVLTSANGHNLTQEMFDNISAFGELIAGKKFAPSDIILLKNLAIKDFPKDTVSQIETYNKLAKLLSEVRKLNPILQTKFREELYTKLYFQLLAENKLNESSIMTLVYNKYSPIVAIDPTNKIVVTERALESYFEWFNFTQQLLGKPLLTKKDETDILFVLQKQFNTIPLDNKIMLATSESYWLELQQLWSNSSREYQLQKVAQLREIVKDPKVSAPFTFLNITLKLQRSTGSRNNYLPPNNYPIPTFSDFPAPIKFGNN